MKIHASHQDEEKIKRTARKVDYWREVDHHVSNIVRTCPECQLNLLKQQREPAIQFPMPTRVVEGVPVDFFELAGRTYLVYAERMSG